MSFYTLRYEGDRLSMLDQTRLPTEHVYVSLGTVEEVAVAIERLVVRGAPAIGIAAAWGVVLGARTGEDFGAVEARLARTRPTAVNLFAALARMRATHQRHGADVEALTAAAQGIHDEEVASSRAMGELGAAFVEDGMTILTHCNAGALATAELGTALAVIRTAHAQGKRIKVLADETRPVLQGARLTAWELHHDGIDVTVIPDGAVAHFLGRGEIDIGFVGADRIAASGDAANKIGTRGVAGLMKLHDRPLYVVAPWTTLDMTLTRGDQIPIEERPAREVTHVGEVRIVPDGVKVRNPAFDVTPAAWLAGIVTERGVARAPDIASGLAAMADQVRR